MHIQAAAAANKQDGVIPKPFTDLPIREQLRHGLKDMGRSAFSSAKNFGYLGGMFAGIECCIEGLRGKNDAYNGIAGGFLTGALLARKQGPASMAVSAVGFAAFSGAIEWYMRKPDGERRWPVE
jgi:import inner membrane translocase subunit TIM22